MWEEVGSVAADLLLPNPGPDLNSVFDKQDPNRLRVPIAEPNAFKKRLDQSGWFDEEVVAGGLLAQGKAQSLSSMMTGWALVKLVRGRRCKSLPREFCVAVTPTRVVALALSAWSEGGGGEASTDVVVKVKREQRGSWARGAVRLERDGRRLRSGLKGGTLDVVGLERFPVHWGDSGSEEMVELLAR